MKCTSLPLHRREFIGLAALPLAQALNRQPLGGLPGRVIVADGGDQAGVELDRKMLADLAVADAAAFAKLAVRADPRELRQSPGQTQRTGVFAMDAIALRKAQHLATQADVQAPLHLRHKL